MKFETTLFDFHGISAMADLKLAHLTDARYTLGPGITVVPLDELSKWDPSVVLGRKRGGK